MLITTLVMALMVQSPSATVDRTRAAFTKCLRDDMKKSLEAKVEEAEYVMTRKANCTSERDACRKAVIALGRAAGDSEKVATEDADWQVEDYHENFTEKFKDYKSTNTLPAD